MRQILFLICWTPIVVFSQPITGFNLSFMYDQDAEISLKAKPVRTGGILSVYYQFDVQRKEYKTSDYEISWERRATVSARSGEPFRGIDSVWSKNEKQIRGVIRESIGDKAWYAVIKIQNKVTQGVFYYYFTFESNWPVTHYLIQNGQPVLNEYVHTKNQYQIGNFNSSKPLFGYFYRRSFNAAPPPFARNTPEDKFLKADSAFVLTSADFSPTAAGLYLFQEDTISAAGFAVIAANNPYPKYNSISGLTGPLIYMTTADEQRDLKSVNNEKSKFDKVILGITKDTERAKNFMRNFYQRVEQANRYFTGYKEGWKTDMGMIYTIFGTPTEVSRTLTNEIWYFEGIKTKFIFHRSGSVFAPSNWFLQRDNSFSQPWFSNIDLWRKGRL